jgi:HEAT repeat protein
MSDVQATIAAAATVHSEAYRLQRERFLLMDGAQALAALDAAERAESWRVRLIAAAWHAWIAEPRLCHEVGDIAYGADEQARSGLFVGGNGPPPFARATRIRPLGAPAVPRLLELLHETDAAAARRAALEALGMLADPRAVEPLEHLLASADEPAVARAEYAETLGRMRSAQSVELLLAVVADRDAPLPVRRASVRTLAMIADARAAAPLAARFLDPAEPMLLRADAASALAAVGGPNAAVPLLARLGIEEQPELLARIIDALGATGHPEAMPALAAVAATHRDAAVRDAAAQVIESATAVDEEETTG